MKRNIIVIFFLCLPVFAQQEMTVEDAIKIGLEKNYDIQIARNSAEAADNNRGKGTAGFLPTLDVTGNYQYSESEQESNSPFSFGNSDNKTLSGQISLNWTIFDGFRMFVDNDRYNELARLGQYQSRLIIENKVIEILRAYFNLVQQEQLLDVANNLKEISKVRFEKQKIRKELGGVSSTDLLNAQVSFNNDRASLLNQELQVEIARKNLNIALSQDPKTDLIVNKKILIPPLAEDIEQIRSLALEFNSNLIVAQQSEKVAEKGVSLAASSLYPRIALSSSYGYSDGTTNSESRGNISTQSTDSKVGLSMSFNLFNGWRNKIDLQNAKLERKNQQLALENARNQLSGLVEEKYITFQKRIETVLLEEENIIAASQNLQLQQERYQTGTSSSLEFRDAQVNFARAQTSLITAKYHARITILEIQQLTGRLEID